MQRLAALPLVLALCLAAGCATAPPEPIEIHPYFVESLGLASFPEPGPLPDVQSIRAAFHRPILAGCDELTCWYDLPRLFRVRALSCEPAKPLFEKDSGALCRYERQLVPRQGEPGPWQAAETLFSRSTDPATPARSWRVERDRTATLKAP